MLNFIRDKRVDPVSCVFLCVICWIGLKSLGGGNQVSLSNFEQLAFLFQEIFQVFHLDSGMTHRFPIFSPEYAQNSRKIKFDV